jgi:hypothetical protein
MLDEAKNTGGRLDEGRGAAKFNETLYFYFLVPTDLLTEPERFKGEWRD